MNQIQHTNRRTPVFIAGKRYKIRTQTHTVERVAWKPSLTYTDEEFLLAGQELAIYITGEDGREYCAMDSRIKREGIKISDGAKIDLVLQQVAEHFEIPKVDDVSIVYAEKYQENINKLREIEELIGAL